MATELESSKVQPLINRGSDVRSVFENASELDYPFFVFYDKVSEEIHASNFEAQFGRTFFESP